jgi:hypothetical protein
VDTTAGLVDWTGVYTTPVKDQVCEYLIWNLLVTFVVWMFCVLFSNYYFIHGTVY